MPLELLVEEGADPREHRGVDHEAELDVDRFEPSRDVGCGEVDAHGTQLDARSSGGDVAQRLRQQILAHVHEQHVHAAPRDLVREGEADALRGAEHGGPRPVALGEGSHQSRLPGAWLS